MCLVLSSSFITICAGSTNANQSRLGSAQFVSLQKMEAGTTFNVVTPAALLVVVVFAIFTATPTLPAQQKQQQQRQQQQQQEQQGYGGRSGNISFNPDKSYLDYRLSTLH